MKLGWYSMDKNKISQEKTLIRNKYLQIRAGLTDAYIKAASKKMNHTLKAILGILKDYTLGGYFPVRKEPNILPLLKSMHKKGIRCVLPKILENNMDFYSWSPDTDMVQNKRYPSILEPKSASKKIPTILIVPLLTCDKLWARLGYGKGYYDKFISEHKDSITLKIGLCYAKTFSRTKLPQDVYDQKLDVIITENDIVVVKKRD